MSILELKDDGSGERMSEEEKTISKIGTIESVFMYIVYSYKPVAWCCGRQ